MKPRALWENTVGGSVKAVHMATGAVYLPSEVPDVVSFRRGPWRCALAACAVPVFFTRGFTRHNPAGGDPVVVSAKFSCFGGGEHLAGVAHGAPRPMTRDPASGDDGSREHIHRLVGVPGQPREPTPASSSASGQNRAVYKYGEQITGLAGLVEFSRSVKADPSVATTEQIRHDGTMYWWSELAYGTTGANFSTLDARIRGQVNPGRAYFVQGQAKYRVYPTDRRGLLQLHLVNDLVELLEVHVFMPDTADFLERVSGLKKGSSIAVISQQSSVLSKSQGIALVLERPDQLAKL